MIVDATKQTTYKYRMLCDNCREVAFFNIPKGTKANDHIKDDTLCPKCKCCVRK